MNIYKSKYEQHPYHCNSEVRGDYSLVTMCTRGHYSAFVRHLLRKWNVIQMLKSEVIQRFSNWNVMAYQVKEKKGFALLLRGCELESQRCHGHSRPRVQESKTGHAPCVGGVNHSAASQSWPAVCSYMQKRADSAVRRVPCDGVKKKKSEH